MSNTETWRSALGGDADTTTSSNAQHDQLNQSDTDEQHRKRHGIVFEPMPIIVKHLVHPIRTPLATALLINIYRTPVSGVFRCNAFWFRGLWRKPGQHFAVRGKNPAGQFLQEEHDEVQRTCASSA